ncbi:uncharacterized protein LOC135835107 [Planococcus citri]|uniref:uncharacterized protein LOC135835107 n=1 Tax=Planococcus citri TaxID=170843 RepID=UPI0031FA2E2F
MDDSQMKLQCLAAKSVCVRLVYEWAENEIPIINVWKRDILDSAEEDCPTHHWFLWQLREMEVLRFANIPNEAQYQIEDNMPLILKEVMRWFWHHHLMNFFHDQPSSSLSEYIVKLVWNHYFRIDYLATAKNILTNDHLTPLERFRFASSYCIVDEIEKFRDLMDSVPECDLIEGPFVEYWTGYLKNNLDAIDIPKNFEAAEELDLWPAVVYFFDKLDSTRKSAEFEHMLKMYAESNLKDLLAKLITDEEWNLACRSSISKIVEKIVQYGTSDQVRFVWKLFESKMNPMNFCHILETLLLSSIRNARDFEKWTPLLLEIWTSASSHLKQSAIDMKLWHSIGEKFISTIVREQTSDFRARRRQISDPMKFIRMVLKNMSVEKRMEFFKKIFCWLIIWASFDAVDKLMRDFLENYDRDVIELKKVVANCSKIERSRGILIAFGEFNQLDAVVSFYFPGIDGITTNDGATMQNKLKFHKYEFIMSSYVFDSVCFCAYYSDWKSLYEYVQKNVSWISTTAVEAIMRKVLLQDRFWTRKIEAGEMNDLKEFVKTVYSKGNLDDRTSTADAQLKFLKERYESHVSSVLFEYRYTNCPKKVTFDRTDLQAFLLWIYNGGKNLINGNFKQPRMFPEGFLVQLRGCVDKGSFQVTKSMVEFLEWCFATETERQQFKRKMIYDYRKHKMIEGLLTCRELRRRMLFWFFDDDISLIEKFTADCADEPMCPYYARLK